MTHRRDCPKVVPKVSGITQQFFVQLKITFAVSDSLFLYIFNGNNYAIAVKML